MRIRFAQIACIVLSIVLPVKGQGPSVTVKHVERLQNSHNPQMLYWFINSNELQADNWKKHLQTIEENGTFDFIFLTARNGVDFYNVEKMKPFFTELVRDAHAHHIKIGLQLWTKYSDAPDNQLEGAVVESTLQFDARGHAEFSAHTTGPRVHTNAQGAEVENYPPVRSELMAAYAFQQTGEGTYAPGTLVNVTSDVKVTSAQPGVVTGSIDKPALAGKTLYVLTVHYHRFPDMFGDHIRANFHAALEGYKDVGFDGSALDEFRYMDKGLRSGQPYRSRIYTAGLERYFAAHGGGDLKQAMLTMRYVPDGKVAERDRTINLYMEAVQAGPLGVETFVHDDTIKLFGANAFHGIHDTWHNALPGDEVWGTGIDWWTIPRDYAQTDETTPMTTRQGMALARPKVQEYNQYYSRDAQKLFSEALNDARFNARVHYHAMNDQQGWGIDISSPQALPEITAVEDKVRLLNAFDAPRPQFNVLYLFGFPALLNWVQPEGARNQWDLNGNLHAEEKAVAAWEMGYRGPLAPTSLIESGVIHADDHGGMVFGGERFTAVVMIGPEFAKPETTHALERFAQGGGKLLLDGTQTRDFNGADVTARFSQLAGKAVAQGISAESLAKLGVPKLAIDEGSVFTDGSVVLGDTDSVLSRQPKEFSLQANGHTYTGTYEGLVAIKAAPDGTLEKFAGGAIKTLDRDGVSILSMSDRADVLVTRTADHAYTVTVVGPATPTLREH